MLFSGPTVRGSIPKLTFFVEVICILAAVPGAAAAAPDRIAGVVDSTRTRVITGNVHHLAQAQYDRGEADPKMPMNYMVMLLQPSPAQRADLAELLADQQNPASPQYHKWLTPQAFGDRFGLSPGDLGKFSSWLQSEGFILERQALGANWIAFSGAAGQTSRAFHASIHRYTVNGETHFANAVDPQGPEALSGIAGAFLGFNDFHLSPAARLLTPEYNSGAQHYIAPADFSTIYDLTPIQQSGLDGAGQSIAIVGESDVLASDLAAFRARYGLPVNAHKMLLYSGVDPGYNEAEVEGALDLEWAGAIAPKATFYYVYGASALTAMVTAIDAELAPIVSISYGDCEVNFSAPAYEAVAQQANAQGITIVAASGDSGGARCDAHGNAAMATLGRSVEFPAALPEVTGIGGAQFVEGSGIYWAGANSSLFGSALSYIPETTWNETGALGLLASGGGASRYFPKPAWQTGPGVPADNARDVPDLAFSAAMHDGYAIVYGGQNASVAGTSCGTPTMAAMVALLNQDQIKNGATDRGALGQH